MRDGAGRGGIRWCSAALGRLGQGGGQGGAGQGDTDARQAARNRVGKDGEGRGGTAAWWGADGGHRHGVGWGGERHGRAVQRRTNAGQGGPGWREVGLDWAGEGGCGSGRSS